MNSYSIFPTSYTSTFPPLHSLPIPPPAPPPAPIARASSQTILKENDDNRISPFQQQQQYQQYQQFLLLAPPKYPKYLGQTAYVDLIHEQYEQALQERKIRSTSYHGPSWKTTDLRLPSAWNWKDKAKHIDVDSHGLHLKYAGPGKTEAHAASIRSNFPMRPQSGIFYYEIQVVSKGDDGYIGIGFCTKNNDLERLPGWDANSFGYHGDDGHGFAGSGIGETYGPSFTTGDVIGCGVNFSDATAFYTKNGTYLGVAFSCIDLSTEYYPVVGLRTPGEHVVTNFGDEAFVFDVEHYIKEKTTNIWKSILQSEVFRHDGKLSEVQVSSPPTTSLENDSHTDAMAQLVMSHLLHHGYTSTTKSLGREYQLTTGKTVLSNCEQFDQLAQDMEQRQDIRLAIMKGDIDGCIRMTNLYYPDMMQQKQDIMFDLQCSKFVEIMREYIFYRKLENGHEQQRQQYDSDKEYQHNGAWSTTVGDDTTINDLQHQLYQQSSVTPSPSQSSQSHSSPSRRKSWASIAAAASESGRTTYSDYYCQHQRHCFSHPPTTATTASTGDHHIPHNHQHHSIEITPKMSVLVSPSSSSSSSTFSGTTSTPMTPTRTPFTAFGNLHVPGDGETDKSPFIDDEVESRNSTSLLLLQSAMKLGQQLQDDHKLDKRPFIKERLTEIFSLLAYRDIENSPAAPLLDISCRDQLATKLNAAILESQSKSKFSSLEKMYQQALLVNRQLAYEGNGQASMLKIDCLNRMDSPLPL